MERDPLARSILTGESSSLTPRDSPAVFSTTLPTSERARRTPKMSRFRGSSSQQRPGGAARPVSLFVDGPATSSGGSGSGLVRSSSLRRIPESETASTSPPADLSPQLETALGKLSASSIRGLEVEGYIVMVPVPIFMQCSINISLTKSWLYSIPEYWVRLNTLRV
jgi:hypothetical protein